MSTFTLIQVQVSIISPGHGHYPNLAVAVRAAENLKKTLWGKELALILEEISVNGTTWKYVPKHWINSLKMRELGYREPGGLLVRSEYDVALRMEIFDREIAMKTRCGGVIVTGQAGIGVLSSTCRILAS
jgi:hypothetical protein